MSQISIGWLMKKEGFETTTTPKIQVNDEPNQKDIYGWKPVERHFNFWLGFWKILEVRGFSSHDDSGNHDRRPAETSERGPKNVPPQGVHEVTPCCGMVRRFGAPS